MLYERNAAPAEHAAPSTVEKQLYDAWDSVLADLRQLWDVIAFAERHGFLVMPDFTKDVATIMKSMADAETILNAKRLAAFRAESALRQSMQQYEDQLKELQQKNAGLPMQLAAAVTSTKIAEKALVDARSELIRVAENLEDLAVVTRREDLLLPLVDNSTTKAHELF